MSLPPSPDARKAIFLYQLGNRKAQFDREMDHQQRTSISSRSPRGRWSPPLHRKASDETRLEPTHAVGDSPKARIPSSLPVTGPARYSASREHKYSKSTSPTLKDVRWQPPSLTGDNGEKQLAEQFVNTLDAVASTQLQLLERLTSVERHLGVPTPVASTARSKVASPTQPGPSSTRKTPSSERFKEHRFTSSAFMSPSDVTATELSLQETQLGSGVSSKPDHSTLLDARSERSHLSNPLGRFGRQERPVDVSISSIGSNTTPSASRRVSSFFDTSGRTIDWSPVSKVSSVRTADV